MKSLKEKIEVMQAALDGKEIEYTSITLEAWITDNNPSFNWNSFDYRIKQEPREFWVSIFDTGSVIISPTYGEAPANTQTIKVREVTE